MTDVHWIFDNRINKEINTLVKAGYEVYYVAPAEKEELKKYVDSNPKVHVVPIHRYKSKRQRMIRGVKEAYKVALSVDADIYHFHDPELIRAGIWLKLHGKKVIYDVHENYRSNILLRSKKKVIGYILKNAYAFFERIANALFDGIVVVTPEMKNFFSEQKTIILPNYPDLSIFKKIEPTKDDKSGKIKFIYLGSVNIHRGIKEMIEATAKASKRSKVKLMVIGRVDDEESKKYVKLTKDYFDYQKQLPYEEALNLAATGDVGLLTVHPTRNHLFSSPNKLFEYMALGLPIIASDFPAWHEVLDEANCAVYVDPLNVNDIAEKMISLANNPEMIKEMGERGKKMVFEKYNWVIVEKRLLDLYHTVELKK